MGKSTVAFVPSLVRMRSVAFVAVLLLLNAVCHFYCMALHLSRGGEDNEVQIKPSIGHVRYSSGSGVQAGERPGTSNDTVFVSWLLCIFLCRTQGCKKTNRGIARYFIPFFVKKIKIYANFLILDALMYNTRARMIKVAGSTQNTTARWRWSCPPGPARPRAPTRAPRKSPLARPVLLSAQVWSGPPVSLTCYACNNTK